VYSCDAQGRINFYNDAAVKIWGREPEFDKEFWCGSYKIFKPDGTPLPLESSPMAIALKEGRAITGEEIIVERSDGTRSIVRVYPQPEFGLSGEITGIINMGFDVTEQVTARKKLEAQTLMVENMLLTAPAFICTLKGPEHVYELVNERYQALFGKRKIKGKPIMVALPELEGQGFDTLLDKVYNTGEPFVGIEVPITMSKDEGLAPELQYFNFSYQPMYDENKQIYAIMVFGYEVTKEITARKRIEESEKQFRQMAELMPQKVWTADAEGNKTYFNKTLLDYAGCSFEELKDNGWEKLIHSGDWEKNKIQWQDCINTGKDYETENRLLRHDGIYLWHLTRAVAIKDDYGKIKMWVGSKTEIQEQRKQKEALENAVEKRTHELLEANKELAQKKRGDTVNQGKIIERIFP
jgi:PAS domain S-box-containing protein